MSNPQLLTEPEAITPAWLQAVLAPAGGAAVTAATFTAVGTGLMGRSYRFQLESEDHGLPATVVIKFPSADIATRQLGASAYRKEVGFYRDVAPTVTATIPGCYWADISDDGESFVLVLEDITAASQGDQLAGCGLEEASGALRNLARIHASTWGDATLAERPWCRRTESMSLTEILPFACNAFQDRFADRIAPGTATVFEAFVQRANEWVSIHSEHQAAVHGDYRLDNLLFAHDGSAVTTVDWQTVDFLNPGRDLAYFLGNSMTTEMRRHHELELVDIYVSELAASGVADYGTEDALADMRVGAFQGPLVTMLGAFVASRTERSEAMFAAMADRAVAQILDHDSLDLLR